MFMLMQVGGRVLLPATAMFEACAAAARILADALPQSASMLQDFSIGQPLVIQAHAFLLLDAAVDLVDGSVQLGSVSSAQRLAAQHCHGSYSSRRQEAAASAPPDGCASWLPRPLSLSSPVTAATAYVQQAAVAGMWLPHAAQQNGYCLQPAMADATLHLSGAFSSKGAPLQIPVGMAALAVQGSSGRHSCWVHPSAMPTAAGSSGPGGALLNFRLEGQQRLQMMQLDGLNVKAVATGPHSIAPEATIATPSQQPAAELLYVTDWQVEQPAAGTAGTQQTHTWQLDSGLGSTAATVLAGAARSPAGVVTAASDGLALLQHLLVRQGTAPLSLRISAAPGQLASAGVQQGPMAAAAAASLAALAKAAAMEFASAGLSSSSLDALAPHCAATWPPAADTLGTAATQGAVLRARLLRQPALAALPNSHLLPMPRGSLADLRLVQHTQQAPGPGELKASGTGCMWQQLAGHSIV